jgi:uncharacterized protein
MTGAPITFQACSACRQHWYFERPFCPYCGQAGPATKASTGASTVVAAAVVHRSADPAFEPYEPFCIVLADLDCGLRVMGQADAGVSVGDRVTGAIVSRGGRDIIVFGGNAS